MMLTFTVTACNGTDMKVGTVDASIGLKVEAQLVINGKTVRMDDTLPASVAAAYGIELKSAQWLAPLVSLDVTSLITGKDGNPQFDIQSTQLQGSSVLATLDEKSILSPLPLLTHFDVRGDLPQSCGAQCDFLNQYQSYADSLGWAAAQALHNYGVQVRLLGTSVDRPELSKMVVVKSMGVVSAQCTVDRNKLGDLEQNSKDTYLLDFSKVITCTAVIAFTADPLPDTLCNPDLERCPR